MKLLVMCLLAMSVLYPEITSEDTGTNVISGAYSSNDAGVRTGDIVIDGWAFGAYIDDKPAFSRGYPSLEWGDSSYDIGYAPWQALIFRYKSSQVDFRYRYDNYGRLNIASSRILANCSVIAFDRKFSKALYDFFEVGIKDRKLVRSIFRVPGIDTVRLEQNQVTITLGRAFNREQVTSQVLKVIADIVYSREKVTPRAKSGRRKVNFNKARR